MPLHFGILKMSLYHCSYFIKQLPKYFYTFRKSRVIPCAWITQSCMENHSVLLYYAPINVMPDPREGGDTQGIDLISLLLGQGFYFI